MGVDSLPKTVTRQRRGCDFNPGPSAPESSTLTTRLPSHANFVDVQYSRCTERHWQGSKHVTAGARETQRQSQGGSRSDAASGYKDCSNLFVLHFGQTR